MVTQHFILATAGHVDHGKSALVKALTGIDPDRLPEEKARGITIDLGFAHLEIAAPHPGLTQEPQGGARHSVRAAVHSRDPNGAHGVTRPTTTLDSVERATFDCGIVDVPGHEDFVKNMVAGVGSIDLALFIVAADDGWMPQTEEHLQILTYLGVTRAVVALTKIDLAEGNEAAVITALREKLADSPFAEVPIVPTSVVTGRGIDELKSVLAGVLAQTPSSPDIGKPRLPVDRVFTLHGIGTVVTGTLTGGSFNRNQAVVVQPGGQATRVRSLQTHNREVQTSGPGTRTALNLPDMANVAAAGGEGIQRGDVVTLPDFGEASNTIDVVLEKSVRLIDSQARAARPLKDGARVRVHAGSGNYAGRISLIDAKELLPGEQALAQVRFESPVFVCAGDRFIVRDWPELATLAGGVVLDPAASRKQLRSEARKRFLQQRAEAGANVAAWVAAGIARDHAVLKTTVLRQSRFGGAQIADAIAQLGSEGKVILVGNIVVDGAWWTGLKQCAAEAIDAYHKTHSERAGLPLADLRASLARDLPPLDVFDALVADLCQDDFAQVGVAIRRRTHRQELPPQLKAAGDRLRAALAAKPFEPPSRKEVAPDASAQQALRFLIETGEVVELSPELVMPADCFSRLTETLKNHLRKHGKATVSDLRQAAGTSRRVMMPVLERLDRNGVTVRQGDFRVLGSRA